MKSCVIQMPRRAAAGGERLPIPIPADGHGAAWCCWAEPAPASAQPLHILTHSPPAARFSSDRAGPSAQCCRSRQDSVSRSRPSPGDTYPSLQGTNPSLAGHMSLTAGHMTLPFRAHIPPFQGTRPSPRGSPRSVLSAGAPRPGAVCCPREQGQHTVRPGSLCGGVLGTRCWSCGARRCCLPRRAAGALHSR